MPNRGQPTLEFLEEMDAVVRLYGGAVYPAKDARMSSETFRAGFPRAAEFATHARPGLPLAVLGARVAVRTEPRRVLILGATSGIAQAVAREYARRGAKLALVARAADRLAAVASDLEVRGGTVVLRRVAELTDVRMHAALVEEAVQALGGIDVALIAHGVLPDQAAAAADAARARSTWEANFVSAASLAERLAERMAAGRHGGAGTAVQRRRGAGPGGQLRLRGGQGGTHRLRKRAGHRLRGTGVTVVTVKPGPVDTPMTAGRGYPPGLVADVDEVGLRIHQALERGKRVVYVPGRWRWIMAVIRALPVGLFERIRVGPR